MAPQPEDARRTPRENRMAGILAAAWESAAENGLAGVSLSDIARRVGLRQPSLYAYVDSKMDLYSAMFGHAASDLLTDIEARSYPAEPRQAVREIILALYAYMQRHPPQAQLLFERTIPGFEPSPEAFAPAQRFLSLVVDRLAAAGAGDPADVDLFTALVGGLITAQEANEPGGQRWTRHLDTVLDLFFGHLATRRSTAGEPPQYPTRHAVSEKGTPP